MNKPTAFLQLVDAFASLPGVGNKAATRMAYHVLAKSERYANDLAQRITAAKAELSVCPRCMNLANGDLCQICSNEARDHSTLCVVATIEDIYAMEQTGAYSGVYHVLGGEISPRKNVNPDDLSINKLLERVGDENIKELVIATNPTIEGDATALYIRRSLEGVRGLVVSRIAVGLPANATLDYADATTLASALNNRRKI